MAVGGRRAISALGLAAAFFLAAAAWVLFQQGEASLVYFVCAAAGPPLGLLLGGASIALCLVAAGLAWRLMRTETRDTRLFLGRVGLGASAIFGLASLVMTLAIWVVPSCAR